MNMISTSVSDRIDTITAKFESKLDMGLASLHAELQGQDAKLDAQNSKYTLLLWFIGVGVGLIVASNFVS